MAVADADYRFIYMDVGAYGSESDSSVLRKSKFGKAMNEGKLNIPPDLEVYGSSIPYFFLGDDAFPLTKNIMKPFKPTRKGIPLSKEERIFNYRYLILISYKD